MNRPFSAAKRDLPIQHQATACQRDRDVEIATLKRRNDTQVPTVGDSSLEPSIHGKDVDGEYVVGCLKAEKGAQVSDPKRQSGTEGLFVYLVAKGTEANQQRAVEMLQADQ